MLGDQSPIAPIGTLTPRGSQASDESAYVTGAEFHFDGGTLAGSAGATARSDGGLT